MFTLLQRIHTLGLPLWPCLQEDSLCPQDAGVGALLHGLGHVGHGDVLLASTQLGSHCLQPELRTLGDLVAAFLQNCTGLDDLARLLFQPREEQPEVDGMGHFLQLQS